MSRYTYAGPFQNPTNDFVIETNENGLYYIAVKDYCRCGHHCCSRPQIGTHPHTNGLTFEEWDEAQEWIDGTAEFFEEDYDAYLEENRYELAQMDRYEAFRNEY